MKVVKESDEERKEKGNEEKGGIKSKNLNSNKIMRMVRKKVLNRGERMNRRQLRLGNKSMKGTVKMG